MISGWHAPCGCSCSMAGSFGVISRRFCTEHFDEDEEDAMKQIAEAARNNNRYTKVLKRALKDNYNV